MCRRIAAGGRQPLARAVGLRRQPAPTVLDATAGLGRDGYTLAALGARVTLVERNEIVARLLRDAHRQALESAGAVAGRIEIVCADAAELMANAHERAWDVIYLDPMYPDAGKVALPSKEMQILRDLTGGDADADRLLAPARACARRRVVIKRPLKAPWLAGVEPSASIRSTQIRFDIHLAPAAARCSA